MPLTPNQILEIQKIIELHHYAYVANTVGHDAVPEEVLIDLDKKGLLSSESLDLVKQAYLYGQSIAQINDEKARLMPYDKFQDYVKKNPVPLSNMEQRAIAMAQVNAGQYCRGLGNTIEKTTGAILIEADQQLRIRFEGDIKTAVAMNRAKRETISKLKSDLGWATKDWARDLERIAITETMFAVQQGQADYLSDKYGSDSFVAKIPNPSACPHCLRLHIGEDGQPRVFKLSTLENNGANVGRKAADWRAVVGPVHPNCVCSMIRVPDGWGFDEEGELVPGGKLGIKYEEPKELELSLQNDFMKSLRELTSIEVQGIPISIETKEGETRSWINSDGSIGETIMRGAAYGFVENTASMDEEELDVFVGPYPESPMVYVIEQQNPKTELYDEQKCMIGFRNEEHARSVYNANYTSDIDFILVVEPMTINHFKRWSGFEIKKDWVKKGGQLQGFGIAGHRSPGPGLGVNYYIPVPEKEKDEKGEGYGLEAGDLFNEIGEGTSVYVPKEAYEFNNTIIPVHPLVIPEQIEEAHKDARKDAKKNKKVVDDKAKLDKTSRLDTKSLGDIDLEKGGPYIGPRGGKWADPKHTIPWKEGSFASSRKIPISENKSTHYKNGPTSIDFKEAYYAEDKHNRIGMFQYGKERVSNIIKRVKSSLIIDKMVSSFNYRSVTGVMNYFIEMWADTSGDTNKDAILVQMAMKQEFKLKGASTSHLNEDLVSLAKEDKTKIAGVGKLLRAQYEETQEYFKKNGITHVTAFRGMQVKFNEKQKKHLDKVVVDKISSQPLSSWSTNLEEAMDFAFGGKNCLIVGRSVPVEQILSVPATGLGDGSEKELVVIGGEHDVLSIAFITTTPDGGFMPAVDLNEKKKQIIDSFRKGVTQ